MCVYIYIYIYIYRRTWQRLWGKSGGTLRFGWGLSQKHLRRQQASILAASKMTLTLLLLALGQVPLTESLLQDLHWKCVAMGRERTRNPIKG